MSSADKVLRMLALFTAARPVWSPETAARQAGVSKATGYRYFQSLTEAGLIERIARNRYALGPAIIEFDRQIRQGDPILKTAGPVMDHLLRECGGMAATILLCRLYRARVMCVHAESNRAISISSYERGQPRPLLRGATSKIILAHLSPRILDMLWRERRKEIVASGLGGDLDGFKARLRDIRAAGLCVGHGEVDAGRIGMAAPVFDRDGDIVGSLSVVIADTQATRKTVARLSNLLTAAARRLIWTIQPERVPGRARKTMKVAA